MTGKLSYVITPLAGDWIAGYRRPAGPTIDLLPIEAEYDLRAGTLAPPGTPVPVPVPAPPVSLTDRIALLRYGVPLDALVSDLVALLQLGTLGTKLGIANRLSELADGGPTAQAQARANLGLGNVANVAPADLPVSKAQASAIATAVAGLVASSPAALDTLKELADALGDDPNFAATIIGALAGKQPLDADLTAIAALQTTSFGRSLLTLASLSDMPGLVAALDAIRTILSLSGDPAPADIPAGTIRVAKNTATGRLTLWANDGGALVDLLTFTPAS